MKKLISVLLAVTLLCALLVAPVSAATDPKAEKFQEALRLLDLFYEYNQEYMIRIVNDYFVDWENMGPVTVSAAEYEQKLHKHFVLSDAQLASIRSYHDEYAFIYDADAQTYTIRWVGGFGGIMDQREYAGYVKNGETYDVYYRTIHYSFLRDVLPEGTDEYEYAAGLDYPAYLEYEGVTYEPGPEGYWAILGYGNDGKKYTVEMNGDTVRIISAGTFSSLPDKFHDNAPVIYDVPADNSVVIPENDCFEGDTTVTVEKITAGDALQTVQQAVEKVAQKFVAFEFTATKENTAVQPNGALAVTFAIPSGFSTNVKVYYLAKSGVLEQVSATVNAANRTVTAQLAHFSTYVLVDADSAPTTVPTTAPTTVPTTAPTTAPTTEPTTVPTTAPTTEPTTAPTTAPTTVPSTQPTTAPADHGNADTPANPAGLIIAIIAIVAGVASGVVIVLLRKKK